jgi:hypothetical protein
MKVYSLYQDFFKFLEKIKLHQEKWNIYFSCYYQPNQEFFENYFSRFPLIDKASLKQRVEAIKAADYSRLKNLISVCHPEEIIKEAYEKSREVVLPNEEPEVYLLIGFFSPDGFVMHFRGKPVICFGLERFRDFSLLRILFAHEYAHFLLNLGLEEVPEDKRLKWLLISEGLATHFSLLTFPDSRLSDHFLFRRDRFNWCQENESFLREVFCRGEFSSKELMEFYDRGSSDLDIPPRAGKYLGFQAVKRYLGQDRIRNIRALLLDKNLALSLEL